MEQLLTGKEVSELIKVSVETLNKWRSDKSVPLPYIKIGRLVRYRLADIEAYVESQATWSKTEA